MKKILFGLVALGLGALGAQSAEAQHYRPVYRHHPAVVYPRRPIHRPVMAYQAYRPAARCWVRPERVWNGFMWVSRPVRVCR